MAAFLAARNAPVDIPLSRRRGAADGPVTFLACQPKSMEVKYRLALKTEPFTRGGGYEGFFLRTWSLRGPPCPECGRGSLVGDYHHRSFY